MDWSQENALLTQLLIRKDDLLALAMYQFPWGKQGTPLQDFKYPKKWQQNYLDAKSQHRKDNLDRLAKGLEPLLWQHATASGRGPGKSALLAMMALGQMSTILGSTTIVTANREEQLKNATFAEISKWRTLAINGHWFEQDSLAIRPTAAWQKAMERQLKIDCRYWTIIGSLWSEENPSAFVAKHNKLGILLLMDEASGIPNNIGDASIGFFTPNSPYHAWDMFSQGRRNAGFFYDAFFKRNEDGSKTNWRTLSIDARTVEDSNVTLFNQQIAKDGIDSYTVRVEILGLFPTQGENQFISGDAVNAAQTRELEHPDPGAPLIMGVDVARFGDDWNVVRFRQGYNGRVLAPQRWQGIDLYATADKVALLIDEYQPDAICIDAGMGSGVIDILRRRKYIVTEVHFGGGSNDDQWANRGTELYAKVREWLPGGVVDNDSKLFGGLTKRNYSFWGKAQDKITLEPKENFKKENGYSPDDADAFALTFAVTPARRDRVTSRGSRPKRAGGLDYNLFG
jgi:hypothetical protein